jgi:hypothetical protein
MGKKAERIQNFSFGIYESKFSAIGAILIVLGVYYLGTHLNWWLELPFWPVVLIVLGLYLVIKKISYKRVF